jgi:hypothetical protein
MIKSSSYPAIVVLLQGLAELKSSFFNYTRKGDNRNMLQLMDFLRE